MKKRILGILLSCTLLFSILPMSSLASGTTSNTNSGRDVQNVIQEMQTQEDVVQKDTKQAEAKAASEYSIKVEQKKLNYTTAEIQVPQVDQLVKNKKADSIQVTAQMKYNGTVTQETAKTFKLDSKKTIYEIKMPTYGKFNVTVNFKKGKTTVKSVKSTVGIGAEEYNIAPINATFPVIYFTLQMWDITKNENGEPVPTFVMLNRTEAYNWDELPENVYGQPNLTSSELRKRGSFETKAAKMADYVKELKEITPDAHFNLYLNDAFPKLILQILTANGISEDQYNVWLLSDGSGSYSHYNDTFDVADPYAKYAKMKDGWEKAKEYAAKNHKVSLSMMPYYGSSNYAYVVANEDENIEWWVARTDGTLNIQNKEFLNETVNSPRVIVKNMNDMLNALKAKGNGVVNEFKTLYNFNDAMFAEAEAQNKKVMMILGTWVMNEPDYGDFSAYAQFLMNYYGDDYIYYYKGHPKSPTNLYPSKQKELADLGIYDVESSIPAELILFFYPDIYMAGYPSSTFTSVASPEQACGLFVSKKDAAGYDYKDMLDFFMSQITKSSDPKLQKICNMKHDNYLLEFSDDFLASIDHVYDIAVYDYTGNSVNYYKIDANGEYVLLNKKLNQVKNVKTTVSMKNSTYTLEYDKVKGADGYEIQYATRYDAPWKTITVKDTEKVFRNMVKGQTMEVRVRAYQQIGNTRAYGPWSETAYRLVNGTTIKSTYSAGKKTLTPEWKKVNASYGTISYECLYRINGSGKWKTVKTKNLSTVIRNLSQRSTYELRVRPIKTVGGKQYVGALSSINYRYIGNTVIKNIVPSKTSMKVSVNKFALCTGYQVVYSENSSFTKNTKNIRTVGASKTTISVKGLKSKKTYYVKVRPYKIKNGKIHVGAYTAVKKIRTK